MKQIWKLLYKQRSTIILILYICTILILRKCMAYANDEIIPQPDIQIVYKLINVTKLKLEEISIPENCGNLANKPYMDISKITNRSSPQWELLTSLKCVTIDTTLKLNNDTGFIEVQDYIGVAMGSYFDGKTLGGKYHLTLDTGKVLKVIKVEQKDDIDTCELGMRSYANDIIEFVIDSNAKFMQDSIGDNGLVFNGNFNNCDKLKGNIIKIEKVVEREE